VTNEIPKFYDWLETEPRLGTKEIALWFALMNIWQKAHFPKTFTVATSVLISKTRIGETAFKEARKTLVATGRLEWTSRKGRQSAVYKIIPLEQLSDRKSDHNPTLLFNNNNTHSDSAVDNNNGTHSDLKPAHIQHHYEKTIGGLMSPTARTDVAKFLQVGVEAALVCHAIDVAIDNGARNWAYARTIIDRCVAQGILTQQQYKAHEKNRATAKQNERVDQFYENARKAVEYATQFSE